MRPSTVREAVMHAMTNRAVFPSGEQRRRIHKEVWSQPRGAQHCGTTPTAAQIQTVRGYPPRVEDGGLPSTAHQGDHPVRSTAVAGDARLFIQWTD
jgi:hypothetical protein